MKSSQLFLFIFLLFANSVNANFLRSSFQVTKIHCPLFNGTQVSCRDCDICPDSSLCPDCPSTLYPIYTTDPSSLPSFEPTTITPSAEPTSLPVTFVPISFDKVPSFQPIFKVSSQPTAAPIASNNAIARIDVTGPALVGILIAAVGAAIITMLFLVLRSCMTHTHAEAKKRVISFSKSRESVTRTSRGSEDTPHHDYENGSVIDDEEEGI